MNRSQRSTPQSAMAAEIFNHFCAASSMRQILALHRSICDLLTLKPTRLPDFYPKLKDKLSNSWKAQALFKKFDARANHKVYAKGQACPTSRVLIIGAGPCGLRAAIECQLLGAKVVVVEKRDRMSRNNVLHLWPFVIHDLRALGAKKFYGKFCAGAIDHISIRQLQCILLKVCLLLGVEFHEGVGFEDLLEPKVDENTESLGWRANVTPPDHPVSQYEFDVLIGADGKRNTLRGFKRKDFRGKLAIAITANFINRHSEQEASVEEISGVAFIFKQKFFKDLYRDTGIDLENIVYYKDETHYFVMTAKKHSLLQKGVLKQDNPETTLLLSKENVDRDALQRYAWEAAQFSTEGRLPRMEFALNHYGEPDVTLFDFTSMYAAENASMVIERTGRRLLCCLVGDSLLEPFWPTGSGCARGFLSALDSAWAVRSWGQTPPPHPINVLLERESIYRLLAQTTPENLHRDFGAYTLDPRTRYPNLNRASVTTHRVAEFYNSDDPLPLDASTTMKKRRREAQVGEEALVAWVCRSINADPAQTSLRWAVSPPVLAALLRRYRPDLMPPDANDVSVYNVLTDFCITQMGSSRMVLRGEVSEGRMRSYLRSVYRAFKGEVPHVVHNNDLGSEMERSENGNYPEERRSVDSSRKRKRKSRMSQVSNLPSTSEEPTVEPVVRNIGKLDLADYLDNKPKSSGNQRGKQVGRLFIGDEWQTESRAVREKTPTIVKKLTASKINFQDKKHDRSSILVEKSRDRSKRLKLKPQLEINRSRGDSHGKRRAARDIARMHFEKSLRLLAAGPVFLSSGAIDLDNDYGLKQYREAAPEFGERVKKLERKLMHTEEGRAVGIGARSGSGATVARLAAELARGGKRTTPPRSNKPDDLLRSVGKIEPTDWNVRSIERKMEENRIGRPAPRVAERVPKWDREKFVERQQRLASAGGGSEEPLGELELAVKHIDQLRKDSGRPALGTNKVARLAKGFDTQPTTGAGPLVSPGKPWSAAAAELVAASGAPCVVCGARAFAAESAFADGLTVHRSCFRCASCRMALRPGMFLVLGTRLTCLRHSQSTLADNNARNEATDAESNAQMSERITLEASDAAVHEMDEEEWAGRNFLASETSGAGGLSDESSSDDEYTAASASPESLTREPPEGEGGTPEAAGLPGDDEVYFTDYSHEDFSDETCSSSGSSRLAAAREARRREVPPAPALPPGSSEVESDDSDSETETSSGTEVSTDSEFEEEEPAPTKTPPAITVTAPTASIRPAPLPPIEIHDTTLPAPVLPQLIEISSSPRHPPVEITNNTPSKTYQQTIIEHDSLLLGPGQDFSAETSDNSLLSFREAMDRHMPVNMSTPIVAPQRFQQSSTTKVYSPPVRSLTEFPLSRTRSAGGIATKRALELKRRYLLGEPSPTSVRRSDSASRLDSQIENFTMNISQCQALLNPAQQSFEPKIPNSPFNMRSVKPVPLGSTIELLETTPTAETNEPKPIDAGVSKMTSLDSRLDTDSLSDSSDSITETGMSPPVPRLEVHNASGVLVQLDSLIIPQDPPEVDNFHEILQDTIDDSDSSESCKDGTTMVLTENELSDYMGDGGMLADMGIEDNLDREKPRTSARNPTILGAPKNIHEAKNIETLSAHVCGKEKEAVSFFNDLDSFQYADEGEDISISIPHKGYLEYVDDDYRKTEDRSMNFIEQSSNRIELPTDHTFIEYCPVNLNKQTPPIDNEVPLSMSLSEPISPMRCDNEPVTIANVCSPPYNNGNTSLSPPVYKSRSTVDISPIEDKITSPSSTSLEAVTPIVYDSFSVTNTDIFSSSYNGNTSLSTPPDFRSAADSEPVTITSPSYNNGDASMSKSSITNVTEDCSDNMSPPLIDSSRSISFSTPLTLLVNAMSHQPEETPRKPAEETKAQEIKRERDEQTEVVRRLVMQRIGGSSVRKSRRSRPPPAAPPAVPPPPVVPPPPARPPPPLRLMPSMSDPELTRVRRRRGIIQTVSDFFNRRVGIRKKSLSEPADLHNAWEEWECSCSAPLFGARAAGRAGERPPRRAVSHGPLAPSHHRSQCCPPLHRPKTDGRGAPPTNIWTSD